MDVRELTREECIEAVSSDRLAYLACCKDERPYVIPIYYAVGDNCLYSFSMPGRKIEWLRANPHACLLIERNRNEQNWTSVLISGQFQELPDNERWHQERIRAWALLERHANWWEPGALRPEAQPAAGCTPLFYSIEIEEISGRIASAGEPWGREPAGLQD